jgi:hypothetical protein
MSADDRTFDIEIAARASARKLRFAKVPNVELRFRGDGVERSEREGLPQQVRPGVTYRDLRVGWRAGARVNPELDDRTRRES